MKTPAICEGVGLRDLALRVSVTDRCQLRCRYCMPPEGVPLRDWREMLSYEEIDALVDCLDGAFGVAKVRLTGGEPLLRPDIERLIGMLAERGVPDLSLTTNGVRLAELASALKRAGLHRINLSLDSLNPETFRRLTGGGELQPVLAGVRAVLQAGFAPPKLNTVVIRGVNDGELRDIVTFGLRAGCEVRFIELMPIGPGAAMFADGFLSSGDVRQRLAPHMALVPLERATGTSARRYAVTDAEGRRGVVGFISSCSAPFCGECARLRVTADGRLIGCLARAGGVSIRDMLRSGDRDAVCRTAARVLTGKRADRAFEQEMAMASIGG